jgi:hypothetical protein
MRNSPANTAHLHPVLAPHPGGRGDRVLRGRADARPARTRGSKIYTAAEGLQHLRSRAQRGRSPTHLRFGAHLHWRSRRTPGRCARQRSASGCVGVSPNLDRDNPLVFGNPRQIQE